MEEVPTEKDCIGIDVGCSGEDFFKGTKRVVPPDLVLLPDSLYYACRGGRESEQECRKFISGMRLITKWLSVDIMILSNSELDILIMQVSSDFRNEISDMKILNPQVHPRS